MLSLQKVSCSFRASIYIQHFLRVSGHQWRHPLFRGFLQRSLFLSAAPKCSLSSPSFQFSPKSTFFLSFSVHQSVLSSWSREVSGDGYRESIYYRECMCLDELCCYGLFDAMNNILSRFTVFSWNYKQNSLLWRKYSCSQILNMSLDWFQPLNTQMGRTQWRPKCIYSCHTYMWWIVSHKHRSFHVGAHDSLKDTDGIGSTSHHVC